VLLATITNAAAGAPCCCCCCLQGEPKSSATGSSVRELPLPGQLRSMEVPDWAQFVAGGLNAPDLISRVALLPQVSFQAPVEWLWLWKHV
jgi:hypothetical protein